MEYKENVLLKDKHILICLEEDNDNTNANLYYLKTNFCGKVLTEIDKNLITPNRIIYLCGNINKIYDTIKDIKLKIIFVIKELSNNYDEPSEKYEIINIGLVPINIHNVGIYFRKFFNSKDYFNLIKSEHEFQLLTESNKPNHALRKGIYLTKVEQDGDELKFNLLRCSSNLTGSTDNFRTTDYEIINKINDFSQYFFKEKIELNHVLAQIYENSDKGKAAIKAHSDKTKDMKKKALIAFCTFYDDGLYNGKIKKSKTDMFDYCYNKTSVLTRLHFKLKPMVKDPNLKKEFNIILYPNSVFIIPLSTNRLYTHEIKPSILPYDILPTRLGYVVRCSKTKAIFKNNQTYIIENGDYRNLEEINKDNAPELRKLYYEENVTDKIIDYGFVNFSFNKGDNLRPNL